MWNTPLFQVCVLPTLRPYRQSRTVCTLNDDSPRNVRFRKESTDEPRTTFRREEAAKGVKTPNERLLEDVRNTMEELGVTAVESTPPPPAKKLADYSHVSPLSAFAGSVGAALMSAALWQALQTLIAAYIEHPPNFDLYVVQRITSVVRTAVVGLLSLASGISGVTAVGLFLLGGKVSVEKVLKSNDVEK